MSYLFDFVYVIKSVTNSLPAGLAPPKRLREGDAGRRHPLNYKIPQIIDLAGYIYSV
jgi:hypothetical protein